MSSTSSRLLNRLHQVKTRSVFYFIGFLTLALTLTSIKRGNFNNYTVSEQSYDLLERGLDLYRVSPGFNDKTFNFGFKYSPSFAILFAPFAWLPSWMGLLFWNLMSSIFLLWGLCRLKLRQDLLLIVVLIALPEWIGSIQNAQSNVLIAAQIVWAFCFLEEQKIWRAALMISLGTFTKLFGAAAAVLGMNGRHWFKFLVALACVSVVIFFLPLAVESFPSLSAQYRSWKSIVLGDAFLRGFSIMNMVEILGLHRFSNLIFQIPAALVLAFPSLWIMFGKVQATRSFKLLSLASVLVFVVLFNHKSESPTFILAALGLGLWYVVEEPSTLKNALLALNLFFISFLFSDLIPGRIKWGVLTPLGIKGWGLPWLWFWIEWRRYQEIVQKYYQRPPHQASDSNF